MRVLDEGIYVFDREGVIVSISPEMRNVIPRQLSLPYTADMWDQENFRPLRLVMNLEFIDVSDPEKPLQDLEKAILIQVYYTAGERSLALRKEGINRLAYWRNNQWKVPEVADYYPVLSSGYVGYLQFEMTTWGDPTIALGS